MQYAFSDILEEFSQTGPSKNLLSRILPSLSKDSRQQDLVKLKEETVQSLLVKFEGELNALKEFDFSQTHYLEEVTFEGFIFPKKVIFNDSRFNKGVSFENVVFLDASSFYGVIFENQVNFTNVEVFGEINFNSIDVTLDIDLENTIFHSNFEFDGANVGYGRFRSTTFLGESTFNHAEFATSADFTNADFKHHPPQLSDVELPQQTIWINAKWPSKPSRKNSHEHIKSYELLALKMNKVGRHQDKIIFTAKANRSRRVLDKNPLTVLISWIYDLVSGYGTSISKAFAFWIGNILLGTLALMPQKDLTIATPTFRNIQTFWAYFWPNLPISFSNSNSFLNLHRGPLKDVYQKCSGDLTDETCVAQNTFLPFDFLWATQAIFGIILLFFLLLTIRNRFRIG